MSHGLPPEDLAKRRPLVVELNCIWCRTHNSSRSPIHFGRQHLNRWDAPAGEYGVLYLAKDEYGAFMESIGRMALASRFVSKDELARRALSKLGTKRPLRLIDLASSGGLTRIGAEGSLTNSEVYEVSQHWSMALREHPVAPDGILYRSRHDPTREACALYDHCADIVSVTDLLGSWSSNLRLLGEILDHYDFGTDL